LNDAAGLWERSSKRPRDLNSLAKFVTDIVTWQAELPKADEDKNPAAVALGEVA